MDAELRGAFRDISERFEDISENINKTREQARLELKEHADEDREHFAVLDQAMNRGIGALGVIRWFLGGLLAVAVSDLGMHVIQTLMK